MAAPVLPEDQLLELLIQLQMTTPDQARGILSAQPQIAYALMTLMVKLNVVNLEVLQKMLSSAAQPSVAPAPAAPQVSAATVPAHLMQSQQRTGTPQNQTPQTSHAPAQSTVYPGYTNGHVSYGAAAPGYGAPPQSTAPALDPLANIPDEQKAMIMRVIAMTPDQINRLPPNERASIMQLRATLGLPTE